MNYQIYHEGHEYKFQFNYIVTVGDLQTVILQALNIQRCQLLYLLHQDKILGVHYSFDDNLVDNDLYDVNIFTVIDYYEVEEGSKTIYDNWLESKVGGEDQMTINRQIMYFNTLDNHLTSNLSFFTRSDQERQNLNTQVVENQDDGLSTQQNQVLQEAENILSQFGLGSSTSSNSNSGMNFNFNRSLFQGPGGQTMNVTSSSGSALQRMVSQMLNGGGGSDSMSDLFNEMVNQNIYDIGITVTQGGSIPGGDDFFNRLMNNLEPVPVTLDPEAINRLPTFKFNELPPEIKNDGNCSICLEEFNNDSEVRVLLCKHYFHKECIDRWLSEENVRCPLCRIDSRDDDSSSGHRRSSRRHRHHSERRERRRREESESEPIVEDSVNSDVTREPVVADDDSDMSTASLEGEPGTT